MNKPNIRKSVKCVVWDLDDTLWRGILLEESVTLKPGAIGVIKELDSRGLLQSIASRNDYDLAMDHLRAFGLADYFLVPQINWGPKSASIKEIADRLNIGIDSLTFVDDQPFEREEVGFAHPEVLLIDGSNDLTTIPTMPEMMPRFITEDSKRRRLMYQEDFARHEAEQKHEGPAASFLETIGLKLVIAPLTADDLKRAEELTERTHQLNSTGYTYSYEELESLRTSPNHLLLVADLKDRFGHYGRIGLALVERNADYWALKLLIVSCRVMSRGVGAIFLGDIMRRASEAGVPLRAEFRDTGRNRVMNITYRLAGFYPISEAGGLTLLEHDLKNIPSVPRYVDLRSLNTVENS